MATLPNTEVKDITEEKTGLGTDRDFEAAVTVYNCDCHTYQQVIDLLQIYPWHEFLKSL